MKDYGNLIIFDLDGVLFDSKDLVLESVYKTIGNFSRKFGRDLPLISGEKILSGVGLSNDMFIENLGYDLNDEERAFFRDDLIQNEVELMRDGKGKLYPGMRNLLENLKESGYSLAIGSGCKREYLISFLETFDLEYIFNISVCSDDVVSGGKREILRVIMEHQEFFPSETIYIGDTYSDYLSARASGVGFIGVLWGYGRREDFPEDKDIYLVSDLDELEKLLYNVV